MTKTDNEKTPADNETTTANTFFPCATELQREVRQQRSFLASLVVALAISQIRRGPLDTDNFDSRDRRMLYDFWEGGCLGIDSNFLVTQGAGYEGRKVLLTRESFKGSSLGDEILRPKQRFIADLKSLAEAIAYNPYELTPDQWAAEAREVLAKAKGTP